jgi:hypothetical protein
MDRVLQNTAATVYFQIAVDGTATDPTPDFAQVTAYRADGTVLQETVTAAEAGAGRFAFTFTPEQTALVDTIYLHWTAAINGVEQTIRTVVEIVGGFLFSIGELRALSTGTGGLANVTNFPAEKIVAMRTRVEQSLEDACGVAFVPRYARETVSGTGSDLLRLRWPRVRAIRDVTIDSSAVSPVADVAYAWEGYAYLSYGWAATEPGNVTIGYEHGHDYPPERMRQAAMLLAKQWLSPTAIDDRAINMSNDTGTYALFQAGVRGHQFSIPEVQAAVDEYTLTVGIA